VVLPLGLGLPETMSVAPAVVTQTPVEVIGIVVLVRLMPRLIPSRDSAVHVS
jgi:hypothetical protein